jgi:hypothetical protein
VGSPARLGHPGSKAHIDHLVIGPSGGGAIDTKQYRGRLRLDSDGMVWHGRHLLVSALRKTLWEADQADEVLDRPAPADPQAVPTAARGAQATGHPGGPAAGLSWPRALRAVHS